MAETDPKDPVRRKTVEQALAIPMLAWTGNALSAPASRRKAQVEKTGLSSLDPQRTLRRPAAALAHRDRVERRVGCLS